MFNIPRSIPALLIAAASVAAPACATRATYYGSYGQRDGRDFERRVYDNGYRVGLDDGQRDERDRRDFRIERDRMFRNLNDRDWDDRDAFRRVFRDGYQAGYTEGYNRFARSDRYDRRGYPADGRAYGSVAARIGYRD